MKSTYTSKKFYLSKTIIIAIILITSFNSIAFAETLGGVKSTSPIANGMTGGPTLLPNDFYGASGNVIGDLDADGVSDILIGAYGDDTGANRAGAVHITYLNSDGTLKSSVKIANGTANGPTLLANDFYGYASSGIGDLDNDGIPDILVGAKQDDTGGIDRGAAYIHFMNRDGSIKSTVKLTGATANGATLADSDVYAYSVSGIGDLDGDGIPDILIGADGDDTGGTNRGAAYIHFMNRDGSIKSTVKLTGATANGATLADSDSYGSGVGVVGDIDGDGIQDIGVGAISDHSVGTDRGAVYIHFMNRDGTIKSTKKIDGTTANGPTLSNSDFYGVTIANLADIDGDAIPDIGVGSFFDDSSGLNLGAFYIHFMNRDGSLKSTVRINSATPNGPTDLTAGPSGARYGNTVFSLGDLNNDGAIDIGVGASTDSATIPVGNQHGRVFLHFMQPVLGNRITKTSLTVFEGGATDTFSISLKSKPTSTVTVSLSGSQITPSPTSLTFTSLNWNIPQVVTVTAIDDSNYESGHSDTLSITDSSSDPNYNNLTSTVTVSIVDNDQKASSPSVIYCTDTITTFCRTKSETTIAPNPTVTPTLITVTAPTAIECGESMRLSQNLKIGSRDGKYNAFTKGIVTQVKRLQTHATRLGFQVGALDGIFGRGTDQAIKVMQKYFGLSQDGVVGPLTRAQINNSCSQS